MTRPPVPKPGRLTPTVRTWPATEDDQSDSDRDVSSFKVKDYFMHGFKLKHCG